MSAGSNSDTDNIKNNKVMRLTKNRYGRDFVVGDIHGNFDLLEIFLKDVSFDKASDRLISVGDFIDRGPDSISALDYLNKDWFYSVRGNHEAMLIGARDHVYGMYELWMHNGGEWSEDIEEDVLDEMASQYRNLPYIIEVETDAGKVGVVHADMPGAMTWDQTLDAVENDKLKSKQMQVFLWSRDTFRKLRMSLEYPGAIKETSIEGVHQVYVGHSIVKRPVSYGNMMFIDTGAYISGKLSIVDITNEEIIMVETA